MAIGGVCWCYEGMVCVQSAVACTESNMCVCVVAFAYLHACCNTVVIVRM